MSIAIDSVPPPARLTILGSRVDRVTLINVLSWVLRNKAGAHQIVTANALMLLAAENDPELRGVMENAALVVPESRGVQWASRQLDDADFRLTEVIPGIDLMTAFCALAEKHSLSVFFLGARPGVAEAAALRIQEHFPELRIVGVRDGYFQPAQEAELFATIRNAEPHFLFVGMDMPRQEKWIAKYMPALSVPIVMGVGGSFDVLSGQIPRAPLWMQQYGLEWLFRWSQEPSRWRRMVQLPWFVLKVLWSK